MSGDDESDDEEDLWGGLEDETADLMISANLAQAIGVKEKAVHAGDADEGQVRWVAPSFPGLSNSDTVDTKGGHWNRDPEPGTTPSTGSSSQNVPSTPSTATVIGAVQTPGQPSLSTDANGSCQVACAEGAGSQSSSTASIPNATTALYASAAAPAAAALAAPALPTSSAAATTLPATSSAAPAAVAALSAGQIPLSMTPAAPTVPSTVTTTSAVAPVLPAAVTGAGAGAGVGSADAGAYTAIPNTKASAPPAMNPAFTLPLSAAGGIDWDALAATK